MNDGDAYLMALLGGGLIGIGSVVATIATGRVPGISGVFARLLRPTKGDVSWRLIFLLGLIGGAVIAFNTISTTASFSFPRPLWLLAPAGLLVGFGARLSGGCTSGHGVCGIGSGGLDSLLATVTFVAAGILTVLSVNVLL